jgi:hypothetical protein
MAGYCKILRETPERHLSAVVSSYGQVDVPLRQDQAARAIPIAGFIAGCIGAGFFDIAPYLFARDTEEIRRSP